MVDIIWVIGEGTELICILFAVLNNESSVLNLFPIDNMFIQIA